MLKPLDPITPGEILLEEYLKPLNLSQNQFARAIGVPPGRVNDVVRGKRSITSDTAARLAVFFKTTPDLWLNLQARYDAKIASRDIIPAISKLIRPIVKPAA